MVFETIAQDLEQTISVAHTDLLKLKCLEIIETHEFKTKNVFILIDSFRVSEPGVLEGRGVFWDT